MSNHEKESSTVVNSVVLNCGVQGCCPTLNRLEGGDIEIVGDDGQKVRLNAQQRVQLKDELAKD
ncbi:hypothetical protein IT408_01645 [Candidatus Uhrbacteria bacterium]|nr:hypothetical protein [Candidatus Uhrbacteria bacterium]